jgi:predicted N-acetyltransferase YhbS
MSDMLVKLYGLEMDWSFIQEMEAKGITIRKPIAPETHLVVEWVREHFSDAWASETAHAFNNQPVSCFVAVRDGDLLGFGCYDATTLGFFGPTGVAESERRQGIGRALLMACLLDMRLKGYGYAIIGWAGPTGFYERFCDAVIIPDSEPGIFRGALGLNPPDA